MSLLKFFRLEQNRTSLKTEIIAGLTTFSAMAYVLVVHPSILGISGMDKAALISVTAIASALATLSMALLTNYPLALAPGMGLNAFFTFSMCLGKGLSWQQALGVVFVSGVLFLILTLTGLRKGLMKAIPKALQIGIVGGIGLFITIIGMKNAGMFNPVMDGNFFVKLSLQNLSHKPTLLAFVGLLIMVILTVRKIPGAILIGIVTISVAGLFLQDNGATMTVLPQQWISSPASIAPIAMQLDIAWVFSHWQLALPLVLSLLFVDVFDNLGTLIGVTKSAGLMNEKGELPRINRALLADSCAAMGGAVLGTSTVTSYVESSAGTEAGGRTGLTGIVVAVCFLLAMFFHPLIASIPVWATTPALIMVGYYMLSGIREIDWNDMPGSVAAFVTIISMPLAYSIATGVALGFATYALLSLLSGKKVNWATLLIAALCLVELFFGH